MTGDARVAVEPERLIVFEVDDERPLCRRGERRGERDEVDRRQLAGNVVTRARGIYMRNQPISIRISRPGDEKASI